VFKKILLFGCLPLTLLAAAAVLVAFRLATWTPPPSADAAPAAPEREQSARRKIEAVQARSRQLRHRRIRPQPEPFHLPLDQEELNALLQRDRDLRQALQNAGIRDAKVEIRDGLMTLGGYTRAAGPELFVSITGQTATSPNGEVEIDIRSIQVGRLPAPPALRRMLAQRVREAARTAGRSDTSRVEGLRLEGNRLVIDGVLLPGSRSR
jgi:hypothetical protein